MVHHLRRNYIAYYWGWFQIPFNTFPLTDALNDSSTDEFWNRIVAKREQWAISLYVTTIYRIGIQQMRQHGSACDKGPTIALLSLGLDPFSDNASLWVVSFNWLINWLGFYAAFNNISVMPQRSVHLTMCFLACSHHSLSKQLTAFAACLEKFRVNKM